MVNLIEKYKMIQYLHFAGAENTAAYEEYIDIIRDEQQAVKSYFKTRLADIKRDKTMATDEKIEAIQQLVKNAKRLNEFLVSEMRKANPYKQENIEEESVFYRYEYLRHNLLRVNYDNLGRTATMNIIEKTEKVATEIKELFIAKSWQPHGLHDFYGTLERGKRVKTMLSQMPNDTVAQRYLRKMYNRWHQFNYPRVLRPSRPAA